MLRLFDKNNKDITNKYLFPASVVRQNIPCSSAQQPSEGSGSSMEQQEVSGSGAIVEQDGNEQLGIHSRSA